MRRRDSNPQPPDRQLGSFVVHKSLWVNHLRSKAGRSCTAKISITLQDFPGLRKDSLALSLALRQRFPRPPAPGISLMSELEAELAELVGHFGPALDDVADLAADA